MDDTVVDVADPTAPHQCIPQKEASDLGEKLTVEAWVRGTCGAEATQAVVSRWASREAFDAFDGHDASQTDGLDTVGYFGAVFDGRHVYWCPIRSGPDRDSAHGRVLRYDTHREFGDRASYEAFDASYTGGLKTSGFYGGAFDGRYVIFNPRDDGLHHHSRFLRYDTHRAFDDPESWESHDAGLPCSGQGVAFDGRYLYRCPGYADSGDAFNDGGESGSILRLDTWSAFDDPDSYRVFDARALSPDAVCFDGGAFDGRHIYFVPLSRGVVLRFDTKGDFGNPHSWETYDAKPLGMTSNVGAVFDGHFIYFAAYSSSTMVRYDTRAPFSDDASWHVHDAANTGGLDTGGFDGGFFDGRYVYYVPFTRSVPEGSAESNFHCNYLRYDTLGSFDDAASWASVDAGHTDGLETIGYNAGAFDGRYFYTAPWRRHTEDIHCRILRYDTTGEAASFSLRYSDCGQNGGLGAALLGPTFRVNTTSGPICAAAHRALSPGRHHLAGVYDGKSIKLFVDGALAAERSASGAVQGNDTELAIGQHADGGARFEGSIYRISVSPVARSDDWIETSYAEFARSTAT